MAEGQNQEGQERTEEPTPKRLEEARRKGQVARSRDLATSLLLMGAAVGVMTLGPGLGEHLAAQMTELFSWRAPAPGREPELPVILLEAMGDALLALVPFLVLCAVVALAAPLMVGGLGWSFENIIFKPSRMDPVKGIGRMFSLKALVELGKALGKFAVVGATAVVLIWWRMPEMMSTGSEGLEASAAHAAWLVASGFLLVCASTVLIAAVDVPFQIWNHVRGLRMSRQDIKDEMRDTEGKPEVRGRIRQLQRELARGRMMEEVPHADVVVTNPTHFAVALRWDQQGAMHAPTVVASGAGEVALRIREVAAASGVLRLEAPALARAIYWSTDIGEEIPAGLYTAVAAVLAWVYRVRDPRRDEPAPPPPSDLPIPEALRR